MNKTDNHFSKQELLQVLTDHQSAELEQRVEQHVTRCDECRDKMESLAGNVDLWSQAAGLLTDDRFGETIAFSSPSSQALSPDQADAPVADSRGYAVRPLLESPSHPEMMGRLGHYEIEREVGRGGMGVVVKAHDTELNRAVAIKMMSPHLASVGIARQRFAREARSAAAILHPNVIAIHAVNTESQTPWLVMPYIVGPSLEQIVMRDGALEEQDLVCFAMQIAAGLAAAHSQGVVHRDIKPANVLIESGMGRVVITDFGLARAECDASVTQTGWFAGTPNFMSPEQASGRDIDHRSDLFSLGSVMYYMATGRLPFRGEQPMAILDSIRNHHPTAVRKENPGISKTISNLIEHLLAKHPGSRIQSASEVHQVLEQYLAHLHHPDARKKPLVRMPARPGSGKKLRRVVAGVATAVCLLVAGWAAWTNWPGGGEGGQPVASFDDIVARYDLQKNGQFETGLVELHRGLEQLEERRMAEFPEAAMFPDRWHVEMDSLEQQINALSREFSD